MKKASVRPRAQSVAAYVRVSSASQNGAMQREAISRASAARGDDIAQSLWYEEKRSAKTTQRPMLELVRQAIRGGAITKLYVWRLDRLTRSGIRDTLELVEEIRRHGCELVTITDGFDLQGPAAEVVLAVLAWAAQMELLAGNERRAAARERILAEGGTWGRPKRTTDAIEERARAMHLAGRSVRAISMALKIPRATVGRMVVRRLKSQDGNGVAKAGKKAPRKKLEPAASH